MIGYHITAQKAPQMTSAALLFFLGAFRIFKDKNEKRHRRKTMPLFVYFFIL